MLTRQIHEPERPVCFLYITVVLDMGQNEKKELELSHIGKIKTHTHITEI